MAVIGFISVVVPHFYCIIQGVAREVGVMDGYVKCC